MLKPAINSSWAPVLKLKALVQDRKENMFSNPIFQAGVYFDPRFRSIPLNKSQQANAKQLISDLHQ